MEMMQHFLLHSRIWHRLIDNLNLPQRRKQLCVFVGTTNTTMKNIFFIFFILTVFSSCRQQPVTNPKDYTIYLQDQPNTGLQRIDTEIQFWKNKLSNTPGDIISESKIAGLLAKRF